MEYGHRDAHMSSHLEGLTWSMFQVVVVSCQRTVPPMEELLRQERRAAHHQPVRE
jgi:hypothetical protein